MVRYWTAISLSPGRGGGSSSLTIGGGEESMTTDIIAANPASGVALSEAHIGPHRCEEGYENAGGRFTGWRKRGGGPGLLMTGWELDLTVSPSLNYIMAADGSGSTARPN